MIEMRRHELLADMRRRLNAAQLGERPSGSLPTLPFDLPEIDAALPTGGLMLGAVHEVSSGGANFAHTTAAAMFAGGILARTNGPVVWAAPCRDLMAPDLTAVGLDPDRVIFVEAGDFKTVPIVMEEALKHVGLAAVIGEIDRVGLAVCRRLQTAAEASGVLGLILRRPRRSGQDATSEPTVAQTRWCITSVPLVPLMSRSLAQPGPARGHWQLELLIGRGVVARTFFAMGCDVHGRLAASVSAPDYAAVDGEPLSHAAE